MENLKSEEQVIENINSSTGIQVIQADIIPMELNFNNKTYIIKQDVHAGHTDKLHKLYLLLIYFMIPNLKTIIDVDYYIKSNNLDEILIEKIQDVSEKNISENNLEDTETK